MPSRRRPESIDPHLLLRAYASGIFPMADEQGVIQWYAPDPRAILEHDHFRPSRSLRAVIRRGGYEIRYDTAFEAVMRACAERPETWINDEIIRVYTLLHRHGFAHSVEAWQGEQLVGGLYGVTLGGLFAGESMFSRATDASKVCLAALVDHLRRHGYVLHDVQFITPHLASLGVTLIPRAEYERRLAAALRLPCQFS